MPKLKGLFGFSIFLFGLCLFPVALIIIPSAWLLGAIFYKKGYRVDNDRETFKIT
jgi:hypothetical protein